MELRNRRWDEAEFLRTFKEVQTMHPNGKGLSLEDMVEYQKSLPPHKRTASAYEAARGEGRILAQPRAGVATLEEMIDVLTFLQDAGGADILPIQVDAYTRRLQFENAKRGLEESIKLGHSVLNGFPVVEHGITGCRKLIGSVKVPVSVRCNSSTARLPITIALASGATELSGAAINCAVVLEVAPYEDIIKDWQFTERLVGWLEERGIPITLEYNGISYASVLTPPAMGIVLNIVDVLLGAEQGVKHHCVSHYVNNCLVQDMAGMRKMEELCRRYLDRFGYHDSVVFLTVNPWHGAYPNDLAQSFAIISVSSMIAAFGKAVKTMVRSVEEARGVPTREWNAASTRATKRVAETLKGQDFPQSKEIDEEARRIEVEVTDIMNRILELGNGDVAVGIAQAVKAGVFDVPFSPNPQNAGRVLGVKDRYGAARYLDAGNLPLSRETIQFHQERVRERMDAEGWDDPYEMVAYDIRGDTKTP
ncbi:MAG: methylaspartate mutase subunit E [Chloroflexi bacterium]|nr:methylaspartate mutase subunit E [Chloroflexota bacterium]